LSSALAIPAPEPTTRDVVAPPHLRRLWQEATRVEQRARLKGLELQLGEGYGQEAYTRAYAQWRQLPVGVRVELPSAEVFARILGLLRTGATLKQRPMLRLELSAGDIAKRLGFSKSTIEAALRWLGCGPIKHKGKKVARGIGLLHRARRTALGVLDGVLRPLYRTSINVLTKIGRKLLGLGAGKEEDNQPPAKDHEPAKAPALRLVGKDDTPDDKVGLTWIRSILGRL